jgi:hypothetical protein
MSAPITRAQREAIARKFAQSPDGAASYREFRARVKPGFGYLVLPWCGMYLGIEKDGHTHS